MRYKWVLLLSFGLACNSNNSEQVRTPANGSSAQSRQPSTASEKKTEGSDFEGLICEYIENSEIPSSFKLHKNKLCDSRTVATIKDIIYAGRGDPEVDSVDRELADGESSMQLYSAFVTPASPKEHFDLMKLQMMDPDDFEDAGYEVGEGVTYEVLNQKRSSVSFGYKNEAEAPAVVAHYEATTEFIDLGNDAYAAVTQLDETKETVLSLKGVVLIFEAPYQGEVVTHVVGVSDQRFDNNNDHSQTVEKAIRNSSKELAISYRNSKSSSEN